MLFYRFPQAFVQSEGGIPPALAEAYRGWIGCVMLVHYHHSPVGPYGELLFIPGLFRTLRGMRFSITRIWVDSAQSMAWGRKNWAIPKEMADFHWQAGPGNRQEVRVARDGKTLLELDYRTWGPRLRVNTGLLPIHLIQPQEQASLEVSPRGHGRGQWARIGTLRIDHPDMPDISAYRPVGALRVTDFQMVFPPATPVAGTGV